MKPTTRYSLVDLRHIAIKATKSSARPFQTAGISRELGSDWSQVNSPADAVRLSSVLD